MTTGARDGSVDWRHLRRMTDDCGLLEHAQGAVPKRWHGYCIDDNGRALGIVTMSGDAELTDLAERYLAFCQHAYRGNGTFNLRMDYSRVWLPGTSDDASGRAIEGLGRAATLAPAEHVRRGALALFERCHDFRSGHARAMAHAVVGADAVLRVDPDHRGARRLLNTASRTLGAVPAETTWPWSEPRLTYANALIPTARLMIGEHFGDADVVADAIRQLQWLVALQRGAHGLSLIPHTGWSPGEARPRFDQQPIELWHLPDAAERAHASTGDSMWLTVVSDCVRWFEGDNDLGVALSDPISGGGCDGLRTRGLNENQGAESTLAWIAVQLVASRIQASPQATEPRWALA